MKHQLPGSKLPYGLIASRSWLTSQGVERHTIDNWLKSGQLVSVARGVFKRPESDLTWQVVVSSLQHMGLRLAPGGLTALAMHGMTHYLSPLEPSKVHLYGEDQLPAWVNRLSIQTTFIRHMGLMKTTGDLDKSLAPTWNAELVPYGTGRHQMQISSPELAILEALLNVPSHLSFEHADQLMQGMPTLSPQRLTRTLEGSKNVKVKRLFLWLAERNHSPWLKRIDQQKFSIEGGQLGSGKRVIAKGGKLDRKYLITVPSEMLVGSNE